MQKLLFRLNARVLLLFPLFCAFLMTAGCSGVSAADRGIKLVSWNVETFFDATTNGTEYAEFTGSRSKWNADKYRNRLKQLTDYMKEVDADIYCFMEIENEAVVMDISNQLQGSSSHGTEWNYAAFGKDPGGAIGCAVFSKLPLDSITLHQIDYRTALPASAFESVGSGDKLEPPAMRPLLEIRLHTGDQSNAQLALFVCHWKSKSGGEEESAVWRSCQEALLARRIRKVLAQGAAVLACGDFNRGLSEFMWSYQDGCVELRDFSESVTVYSPWFSSSQPGSYFYQGEWNKLDHIFTAGGTTLLTFFADTGNGIVTDDGIPYSYNIQTGKGWSDHLPLICTFTVSAQ
ncbi:MAG: endonuclease/exonuclease/phosphatase family protein [Treponema sp.]|nr:endonuclease/exonuclease/phosphatase family protein [Candidatus Treponema caballi]